jgi:hypothetical protein
MIAAQVGVTPGQVSAVAAHVKMGTYEKYAGHDTAVEAVQSEARGHVYAFGHVYALLEGTGAGHRKPKRMSGRGRILIGTDAEADEEVVWNPDPSDGTANPHMLILGESGFGKTYAIGCILTELAQQGTPSVVHGPVNVA